MLHATQWLPRLLPPQPLACTHSHCSAHALFLFALPLASAASAASAAARNFKTNMNVKRDWNAEIATATKTLRKKLCKIQAKKLKKKLCTLSPGMDLTPAIVAQFHFSNYSISFLVHATALSLSCLAPPPVTAHKALQCMQQGVSSLDNSVRGSGSMLLALSCGIACPSAGLGDSHWLLLQSTPFAGHTHTHIEAWCSQKFLINILWLLREISFSTFSSETKSTSCHLLGPPICLTGLCVMNC